MSDDLFVVAADSKPDGSHWYWTGSGWSDDLSRALGFDDRRFAEIEAEVGIARLSPERSMLGAHFVAVLV